MIKHFFPHDGIPVEILSSLYKYFDYVINCTLKAVALFSYIRLLKF